MKVITTIIIVLIISVTGQAQYSTYQTTRQGVYPHCGYDYNCFYEEMAKTLNQQRQAEKDELDAYRSTQLQMQEMQLEEVQEQNDILDQQLEFEEDRARIEDERYEKKEAEQLKMQQEREEQVEDVAPAGNVF